MTTIDSISRRGSTPLVVSDAGAIPEVVGPDGLCADLVPPGDVGALALVLGSGGLVTGCKSNDAAPAKSEILLAGPMPAGRRIPPAASSPSAS